jgi:hypothetical protein
MTSKWATSRKFIMLHIVGKGIVLKNLAEILKKLAADRNLRVFGRFFLLRLGVVQTILLIMATGPSYGFYVVLLTDSTPCLRRDSNPRHSG